jgi:Ran GTPase-activating protein (RanGAP) involved in mRNA processing and transport
MSDDQKVNSECLSGLQTFKDHGLLKLSEEATDDTLRSSWPPSCIHFDADGYVTLLDLGGKRLYKGFPTSTDIFEKFTRLATLNLAGTDLPLKDIMSILTILNDQLECLHVGGNGLRHEGGETIGTWLPSATKLVKLDVRYNDMGGDGITSLCRGLKDHPTLLHLYAEGNQMDDAGALAIANLLQESSSSIRELFLGANQIQSQGAKDLAASLRSNNILSKLYLEGNNIGLVGADHFSEVLEELNGDTSLKNLFVDNNNIGKEGSERLAKALNSATAIGGSLLEQ